MSSSTAQYSTRSHGSIKSLKYEKNKSKFYTYFFLLLPQFIFTFLHLQRVKWNPSGPGTLSLLIPPESRSLPVFASASVLLTASRKQSAERQPWAIIQLLYKLTHPFLLLRLAHTASPWSFLQVHRPPLCVWSQSPSTRCWSQLQNFIWESDAERNTF